MSVDRERAEDDTVGALLPGIEADTSDGRVALVDVRVAPVDPAATGSQDDQAVYSDRHGLGKVEADFGWGHRDDRIESGLGAKHHRVGQDGTWPQRER
jgi:hypothetical protein